jgi:hypothetical protein
MFLIAISSLNCINENSLSKFNSPDWKSGTALQRGTMATDLIETNTLIHKTKMEVIAILGIPQDSSKTDFNYILDYGYLMPFSLDIYFDKKTKKVFKAEVTD